jgi:hypothetical protein
MDESAASFPQPVVMRSMRTSSCFVQKPSQSRDASGTRVAPGAYLVAVDIAGDRRSSKVILLR